MKNAKIQSPGRRAMAQALKPDRMIDTPERALRLLDAMEGQTPMLGKLPDIVARDPRFRMLFQQWKLAGGKKDSPYVALMRSRWAYLTQEQTNATGSDPPS